MRPEPLSNASSHSLVIVLLRFIGGVELVLVRRLARMELEPENSPPQPANRRKISEIPRFPLFSFSLNATSMALETLISDGFRFILHAPTTLDQALIYL